MTADCWNYVLPDDLPDQSAFLSGEVEGTGCPAAHSAETRPRWCECRSGCSAM